MTGYDEAVAWFRADPERVRDLDDVDNRSAAITIVNAVLAEAVAAGRDLTANDVRDALSQRVALGAGEQRVAERLNRIARPSRGVGQPDTTEPQAGQHWRRALWRVRSELHHQRDGLPERDRVAQTLTCALAMVDRVERDALAAADPSPRSWSLSAPPPDDVTVVHVGGVRFDRDLDMWRDSVNGEARRWSEVLSIGTVVEGEPPAPEPHEPPRFERDTTEPLREFTAWLVGMDNPEDVIGRERRRTVTLTQIIDRARAALAAAGAVREEEER